jgi:hypothetical protein
MLPEPVHSAGPGDACDFSGAGGRIAGFGGAESRRFGFDKSVLTR